MKNPTDDFDHRMMRRALDLARKGQGQVEPNPMVGAVITVGETTIGEGYHSRFGGPHAEIEAMKAAGDRSRGATLYVTLEPCCHHGKTPPCTDAVIAAGIARVVVAMQDPFPSVAGGGLAVLREAGVDVTVGVCENEALELNAPFLKLQLKKLPYVIAKWAMTLDGKIATATGDSRWVSGEQSRRVVHQLRSRVDAVMVGIETVLRDDPLLTCRIPEGRSPRRIIVDSRGRLPVDSQLVKTIQEAPVWVACGENAPKAAVRKLVDAGCDVFQFPERDDHVDLGALFKTLGEEQLTNILVEGGSRLFGSLFEARLVDRVMAFIAPKLVGGGRGPTPVGGLGVRTMDQAWRLADLTHSRLGEDVLIQGKVVYGEDMSGPQ